MKKKILSMVLVLTLLVGIPAGAMPVYSSAAVQDANSVVIDESNIPLRLYYDEEASHGVAEGYDDVDISFGSSSSHIETHVNDDWERWSIPLGNGYIGANVFGRTETERIQLTDKTLANPYYVSNISMGGVNNFSETYIDFGHTNSAVTEYSRELDLKTAVSTVSYVYNGVTYTREYFTSYPDRAMVIKLDASASGALSFVLRPTIPYEQEYMNSEGDRGGKTGTVTSSVENGVGSIVLSGTLEYFDIDFVGLYTVVTDGTGTVSATTCTNADGDTDGTITVSGAKSAYIVINMGTDYELTSETFTSATTSKPTFSTTLDDAMAKVEGYKAATLAYTDGKSYADGYQTLKDRHIADYDNLFGRVTLDLNCRQSDFALTTDALLENYKNGSGSSYIETLYFQYGRYLLIASSREGALPANLQGTWNRYNKAPWSSGYWHNINVQMNYWPAFSTNLAETFTSYVEYNDAYMAKAEQGATGMVNSYNPSVSGQDGGNGWSINTGAYPNDVHGSTSIGNLGFTTQLFWEYYEYTQDETLLREVVYPVLVGAARFITKMVKEDENGNYIAIYSDSPEQYVDGVWYYTDKGTAYAQSFAYQSNYNMLLAAKELGIDLSDTSGEDYAILQTVMEQIDKYDPIRVGLSGQVKEFFKEEYYGDLGEYTHRHISQLVGLYPANVINGTTPAWLDAAEYTLTERGDEATGWGVAHRLNLWARVQNGERAYDLLEQLLSVNTATNLWDLHPPFQIDGNLGGTAGISEMLLQSHADYIEPLAAIPSTWASGSYTGLVARGNFEVSAAWSDGLASTFNIKSVVGGIASVKYSGISGANLFDSDGNAISYEVVGDDIISFNTEAGKTYIISNFEKEIKPDEVQGLSVESDFLSDSTLTWNASADAVSYNVYVAKDSEPTYTLLANTKKTSYTYSRDALENSRMTFAVTAVGADGIESDRALAYRNPDDTSSTVESLSANVIDGELQVAVKSNDYAATFKLYSRTNTTADWVLVFETSYPIIKYADYDSDLKYGVSVVSYFGEESEIVSITGYNQAFDEVDYTASNIFAGLEFKPSATGKQYAHSSAAYGDYGKLTDGDFVYNTGRFSTKASADVVLEATINLPTTFLLGELQLFDFNGTASSANYAGGYMKIEVAVDGIWTTVAEYSSNADILSLRKSVAKGNYIGVDLSLVKAQQIKVYISSPIVVDGTQQSISLNEVQCTGIALNKGGTYSENVFAGYEFAPTDAASKVIWTPHTYDRLTDGVAGDSNRMATTGSSSFVDGTLTFDGCIATLDTLTVNYGTYTQVRSGTGIQVQVFQNGEWLTVINETYDKAYQGEKTFDMGGVEAMAVRLYVPGVYPTTDGSLLKGDCIVIQEVSCSGTLVPTTKSYSNNIFLGNAFVAADSTAESKVWSGSYANITDGDTSTRGAINSYADATMDFEDKIVELYTLSVSYDTYTATRCGSALQIDVYYEGEWTTVLNHTHTEPVLKETFELGGVLAEKVRLYVPGVYSGGDCIVIYEMSCTGYVDNKAEDSLAEDESTNILLGTTTDRVTVSGASAHSAFKEREYQMFDGDVSTRFAVTDASPYAYSVEVDLGVIYPLYTLSIYPFHNLGEASRSDDTSVEVYLDGVWIKVVDGVTIANSSHTDIDLGGVKASKLRINFANTTWSACASIYEIKCTTGTVAAVDRTGLIDGYKAVESADVGTEFGLDAVKGEALRAFRKYLMNTLATAEDIETYIAEMATYITELTSGSFQTSEFGDFTSGNLGLEGDIKFNIFGDLSDNVLTLFPDAFVLVEYADGTQERVYLADLELQSDGRYMLTLDFASAEMTDTVKLRLVLDGTNYGAYVEQSILSYANAILADPSYETAYPGINDLLTAMLNYGGYAQSYFGYNTDDLANAGIDSTLGDVSEDAKVSVSGSATGLSLRGWSLMLDSAVSAKIYVTLADGADINSYSVTLTDPAGNVTELVWEKVESRYRVVIENIVAAYLDNTYTLTITNILDNTTVTLNSSAMCYVSATLAQSTNLALVNLVKAMKLYNEAANTYFGM